MGISLVQLIVILLIILLLFGVGKLPQVMGDIGKGVKSLKKGLKEEEKLAEQNVEKIVSEKKSDEKNS